MKPLPLLLLILLLLCLALLLAALIHTLLSPARKATYRPDPKDPRAEDYARKLSRMVQSDTCSFPDRDQHETFEAYHAVLRELFPLVHSRLEITDLDGSLLYKWKGRSDTHPIVLMGHQDTVPVGDDVWEHAPFSGDIADGKVWGRGSVDTKCSCMAVYQACEELLAEGHVPPQDIYLSTSCTEEWGGPGCPAIVEELRRRGVKPWLVCDEGGGVYTDPMFGVRGNYAMIGVSEKGRANIRFIAKGPGGHASTPRRNSPIARLSAFVCAVDRRSPFRSEMEPEIRAMLEALAPAAAFPIRLVLGNLWLFKKPVEWFTPLVSGQAAAMLGSTITFTMASGSNACNVMPREATLGANVRFVHHQDMDESLAVLRRLAARFDLEMEVLTAAPCSKMVDLQGSAYRFMEERVAEVFPGCVCSPLVLTAATDCSFYDGLCDNCIRFAPIVYSPEARSSIHGVNEALPYDCLPGAVDFFKSMITRAPEK
ncbi:MAG: M20/M25/M40 family metallo-hydrolase [Lachnospiraceae bacterium]|nr:M20/M25/M40 family metallo-hydrolase [Lachnospiraceae bacterium]